MNEELQKQLAGSLDQLLGLVKDGASWAKVEVPAIVQDKIFLGRITETVDLVTITAITAGLIYFSRKFAKTYLDVEREYRYRAEGYIGAAIILGVLSCGTTILTLAQLQTVLKVWFAPRLYILDWLVSMVK